MPAVIYTEPPNGDLAHDFAVGLAIVQKYRPDLSILIGLINGATDKQPGASPANLREAFLNLGRIAVAAEKIAGELKTANEIANRRWTGSPS